MSTRAPLGACSVLLWGALGIAPCTGIVDEPPPVEVVGPKPFSGERALEAVRHQVLLGPRVAGTPAHQRFQDWAKAELEASGWTVEVQISTRLGHPIANVVARRGEGAGPFYLFGAHYDSRLVADQDSNPAVRAEAVPGANDGASGVAVLLELARVLPGHLRARGNPPGEVWLVLFDAEDNGRLTGWDWCLGSRNFAEALVRLPDAVVVVDMVGDRELELYFERNSDRALSEELWAVAHGLGYTSQFRAEPRHWITDDHLPFLERGIPSVDLIDFDYPYWHTSEDVPERVSAESLEAVGQTLLTWYLDRLGH